MQLITIGYFRSDLLVMNNKQVYLRIGAAVLIFAVLALFYVRYNLYKKKR